MGQFAKNVSFTAVDLHHIALSDWKLARNLLEIGLELVASGDVKPPSPLHLYPVSDIEKAFRYMQSGKNTGRIIITVGADDVVPVSIASFLPTMAMHIKIGADGG
jgi:hypothetical protein